MYFFDAKKNILKHEIDDAITFGVCWADRGFLMKVRILNITKVGALYDSLNSSYSKLIYDFQKQEVYASYEGQSGIRCDQLQQYVQKSDWNQTKYAFLSQRGVGHIRMVILPKAICQLEYSGFKGMLISKVLIDTQTGNVKAKQGKNAQKCINFYFSHKQQDSYEESIMNQSRDFVNSYYE